MRRSAQKLDGNTCLSLLENASSGVLALSGTNEEYPYAVPLSFAYNNGNIYFHGAKSGHKFDLALKNPKASFCIISRDDIIPEKFTTAYRSVVAFGTLEYIKNDEDKKEALRLLCRKYSPNESTDAVESEISKFLSSVCVARLTVEHISGKQGKELLNE